MLNSDVARTSTIPKPYVWKWKIELLLCLQTIHRLRSSPLKATQLSTTPKFLFQLSPEDRDLLARQFNINNPISIPGLCRMAPVEVDIAEVEAVYALDLPNNDKSDWPNCCACKPRQKHKAGYLVRFGNGQRGLLGQDCGTLKHRLDYREMVSAFDDESERAALLRQAIAAGREVQTVQDYIRAVRASTSWSAMVAIRKALEAAFPAFMQRLFAATNGIIMGRKSQNDFPAMQQRDARLEQALERLASRTGAKRGEPGVDGSLRAQLLASGNEDARSEPIKEIVEAQIHRFSGSDFFTPLDSVGIRLQRLEHQMEGVFRPITGKPSASLKDSEINAIRVNFMQVLQKASEIQTTLEQARSFLEADNLAGIVGIWNSLRASRPDHHLTFDGRQISRGCDQTVPTITPILDVSGASLGRAARLIEEAYSDAPQDQALAA